MSNLRRHYVEGHSYFITCVTYKRIPILLDSIDLFRRSMMESQQALSHSVEAWVVLPDHWHAIIQPVKANISEIMHRMKLKFASRYLQRQRLRQGMHPNPQK